MSHFLYNKDKCIQKGWSFVDNDNQGHLLYDYGPACVRLWPIISVRGLKSLLKFKDWCSPGVGCRLKRLTFISCSCDPVLFGGNGILLVHNSSNFACHALEFQMCWILSQTTQGDTCNVSLKYLLSKLCAFSFCLFTVKLCVRRWNNLSSV